jgi:serine/threonine-protein kinase BUR1
VTSKGFLSTRENKPTLIDPKANPESDAQMTERSSIPIIQKSKIQRPTERKMVTLTHDQPLRRQPSRPELIKRDVSMNDESNPEQSRRHSVQERKPVGLLKRLTVDDSPITLGSSRLADYNKISMLGKGTYGEVHKCVHKPTGMIVAMKTYMFEVSRFY